jgi:primosomal protein N' (replication factor Y)
VSSNQHKTARAAPAVLRVAIKAPLSRLFDYLPPEGVDPAILRRGVRLKVPFGRRHRVGLLWDTAAESELPASRLRRALAVLDDEPAVDPALAWLIDFAAGYYHHPLGEVVAAALPALLRQGRPLRATETCWRLTAAGTAAAGDEKTARRAPRQAELLAALAAAPADGLAAAQLDRRCPSWRRVRKALEGKGLVEQQERPAGGLEIEREVGEDMAEETDGQEAGGPPSAPAVTLNPDQQAAVAAATAAEGYSATLIDGVTGSGKTEVYLALIEQTLARARQSLVLVPEIGLTPQLVERFTERLGRRPVILHSGLGDAERLAAWRDARGGTAGVVVGTRSAVFTPLARPGLVIVDEEHDPSLKQQEGFRYSARDLAVARARHDGVPVVLGSATPSLDTLANVERGLYRRVELPQRAGGAAPPELRLVDLGRHPPVDGLSAPLIAAIERHLGAGGQVLLYLNRRGYAPTLLCRDCGHVAECRRCDARMTLHAGDQRLRCHHCGSERAVDTSCPECGGTVAALGRGTERVEEAVRRRFAGYRVSRIDSDSTQRRGSMESALEDARSGRAQILVGTQMLSKGHHFPRLSLVGVLNADQGLFGSDFRSAERLAQTLLQVAGRAGRAERPGEVLIQTDFPQHPLLQRLVQQGYSDFARAALDERRESGWPPYSRIALLRASATRPETALAFLQQVKGALATGAGTDVRLLGPVMAPLARRAGRYRCQLLLQSAERAPLHRLLQRLREAAERAPGASRVRWSLDVDPIELF